MDDDDEAYGVDADFLAALDAAEAPRRPVQQPLPQRLDRPVPATASSAGSKVVQPIPQAMPARSSGSSILVAMRQKGNPILTNLRSLPWEYSDIVADYVLGLTTCALFLSLKYHRLHPEYIYKRIRDLQGKYNLRILLTMVDIDNHEESLKELSKTSLINNVTLILCWSAAEAARYLELYKSYEHANPSAIKSQQSTSYTDKMIDFITVPRSINKIDAVSLVSAFGSVRAAVNASPEEVAVISGWGEKKVRRWCSVVQEPFRVRQAARKKINREESTEDGGLTRPDAFESAVPLSRAPLRSMSSADTPQARDNRGGTTTTDNGKVLSGGDDAVNKAPTGQFHLWDPDSDDAEDEEAMVAAALAEEERVAKGKRTEQSKKDEELSGGIAAALAKLRKE